MSWDDLDISDGGDAKKKTAEARQAAVELAKAYTRTMSSDDGKKVLEDLVNRFIMNSEVPLNATNINYVSAYCNGCASVVKFILNQMKKVHDI